MDVDQVPQEGNAALGGGRKAVYARDENGKMVVVASQGWEVEEIVTLQAVDALKKLAEDAYVRASAGVATPLEYWMYEKRMDHQILAQSAGVWQWQLRRHLKVDKFSNLSDRYLARYAQALGMSVEEITRLPTL
ncbi:hypothetical protein [Simiduia aestuariiviva]|uniref:Uncharacterized protein n=1 Tax=Simiduia aestuariiviva TaxID=1510459 RepID=A0A839US40_9GAMM|nr:hypothetical protein [Simiduia aestuariiviva]MBB3168338.1 hypothetical protein [Simiduia aestuariiviva]